MAEPENYRRADWRFLLPTARQERVRDVTDQRLARQLPQTLNVSGTTPCDLVVGSDPRSEQLEEAFGSLRPGGTCYFEWRSRLRPFARSLRRRLETAGFTAVRFYWSWPPDIPAVWLPLDAPSAARWVLRRRHVEAAELAWRLALALRLLRPRSATAVRPPVGGQVGPLGTSLNDLRGDPVWALVAPGTDPLNKVLGFVGVRERRTPALVLKMPRTAAAAASLEREAASLRALESAEMVPEGIPRLLFVERGHGGVRAIAESPLAGRPLLEALSRGRHLALVRRATEWLVELAVRTQGAERVETAAAVAEDATAWSPSGEEELLAAAARLVAPADGLPVVFEQRDFSPWNVHVSRDGGLIVYDWESAEQAGFAALDLVYFLAYCGFILDGALETGRARQSYRSTFEGSVAGECITRYFRALAIDLGQLPAVRTLTWLIHLRSALRRDRTDPSAALFLDLLREEVETQPLVLRVSD